MLGLAGLESGLGSVRDSHRHPTWWGWRETGEQSGMLVLGAQRDSEGPATFGLAGKGQGLGRVWAEKRPGGPRERGRALT